MCFATIIYWRIGTDKVKVLRDATVSMLSVGAVLTCESCGKKGHIKDNCWKLYPDNNKKKAYKSSKKGG